MLIAIDRALLVICCSIVLINSKGVITLSIAVIMGAVIVSCMGIFIDKKYGSVIVSLLYSLMCLCIPECVIMAPVIVYEITEEFLKFKIMQEDNKVLIGISVVVALLFIKSFFTITDGTDGLTAYIVALSLIAVLIGYYSVYYVNMKETITRTIDSSNELKMVLEEKNRYLIEKQDIEIHNATLKERNRIAREIHDNVGHMLSRALLLTGAAMTISKEKEVSEILVSTKETLDVAMSSIRESVHDLHDESIDMEMSIKEIVDSIKNFTVSYEYSITESVPREIKYCIISIIKEAVSNILKYSNGDKVIITLREHPAFYQVVVYDNGNICKKTDGKISNSDGIGLIGMKERVSAFGGMVNISCNNGFRVFVNIPKKK